MEKSKKLETQLIHAGEPSPRPEGSVTLPVYQSSTFESNGAGDYDSTRYIRLNNTPNHLALGEKLAAIEGTEAALVTASGMAAITTALLALVGEGEHLASQETLYGGTYHFLKDLFPRMGRKVGFFSIEKPGSWEKAVTPETRAIYVESVSNPMLRIPDLRAIVDFARSRGLVSIIDNTFPSPANFNPHRMGFDVVLHSATKYLNGHSDIVAGCVMADRARVTHIRKLLNILGGSLDPHACFLLHRGMKTLAVRMRHHNEAALRLARSLEASGKIPRVIYPGLASHPDHARAKEWFRGFGGMLSFDFPGTPAEADRFLGGVKLGISAPSLGGVETLVTRPVTTSHAAISPEDRRRIGLSDTLIRVSVGLEDPDDLAEDFLGALGRALN